MAELTSVLAVVGLFMLRIGVPVVVLITLGVFIDRWQNRRNAEIQRMYSLQTEAAADDAAQAEEERKVA